MLYRSVHFKVICIYLSLLCLVACSQITPSNGAVTQVWSHQWLQSSTICRAPCWEGITPGQTTATQAHTRLVQSQLIQSATILTSPIALDKSEVDWQWTGDTFGGRAFYDARNAPHHIQVIQVNYPSTFLLQEVIAAYGDPSHIIATVHKGGFPGENPSSQVDYALWVVYLDKGLLLATNSHQRLDIRPDMPLSTPTFFTPGIAAFTTLFDQTRNLVMVPWQGYGDFAMYCRAGSPNMACRTDTH